MSRLFTFGCSFTQYMWPTWATIVGYDLQKELFNFGLAGIGNVGIYHRIIEADIKYKFTPEDKIMILWTSFSREDRFSNGHWETCGSVFNTGSKYNYRRWLKDHWSMQNDLVKNMTAIISVNKMYKDNILWQGHSFAPYENEAKNIYDDSKEYNEIKDFYESQLDEIPWEIFETVKPFKKFEDSHPDPLGHLDKVQNWIYPALDLQLKDSTIAEFHKLQRSIQEYIDRDKNFNDYDKLYRRLQELFESPRFYPLSKYHRVRHPLEDLDLA